MGTPSNWREDLTCEETACIDRAGFGAHRVGIGPHPAMLVIDAQNYMIGPPDGAEGVGYPSACGEVGQEALRCLRGLLGVCRELGVPEVAGHGYRWSEDWPLERREEARLLRAAVESIEHSCGKRPVGWYNLWMPSLQTRELLIEDGGCLYHSNCSNDDLPYATMVLGKPLLSMPYTLTYNDLRYVWSGGLSPTGCVDYCVRGIDELDRDGASLQGMMSIGTHARWTGHAGRASALREILEHVRSRDDVWVATRRDIAVWWLDHPAQCVSTAQ